MKPVCARSVARYEPVPVNFTLRGLVGSCGTTTDNVALSAVVVVGLNLTAIVHDRFPASDAPQVPAPVLVKSPALVPLIELLIEIVNGDLLAIVALSVLEDDRDTVPYASVVGEIVSGIVPETVNATLYGPSGSGPSETVNVADSLPSAPGANVTRIVHDVFAARFAVQVPPLTVKSPALGPLMMRPSETELVCLLETVTVLTTLVPNVVLPIAKLFGVTVMSTVPVPNSATCCGLVAVLSLTESVALRAPSASGVKPIAIVHVRVGESPPAGQVVAPVANSAGSLEVTLPMNSRCVPVFLTVRFLVDVSPTEVLEKASDVGTDIVVGVLVAVGVEVAV